MRTSLEADRLLIDGLFPNIAEDFVTLVSISSRRLATWRGRATPWRRLAAFWDFPHRESLEHIHSPKSRCRP